MKKLISEFILLVIMVCIPPLQLSRNKSKMKFVLAITVVLTPFIFSFFVVEFSRRGLFNKIFGE